MAATRNPTDIPFASSSVWNIGIGSNAQWSASTDGDASQLHGLNGAINAGAWGQPIYFGTASDPLVTVTNTDPLYPVPTQQLHIPANWRPSAPTRICRSMTPRSRASCGPTSAAASSMVMM
jgi:hypothetical protein